MSKHPKRNQLVIERTCWVWAVSYKRSSGVFNTWNIYGSEEKAKQAVGELKKVNKIQYFTKNKNGWEPVKFEDGSSIPPKGLLQYKPSPFEIETQFSVN